MKKKINCTMFRFRNPISKYNLFAQNGNFHFSKTQIFELIL